MIILLNHMFFQNLTVDIFEFSSDKLINRWTFNNLLRLLLNPHILFDFVCFITECTHFEICWTSCLYFVSSAYVIVSAVLLHDRSPCRNIIDFPVDMQGALRPVADLLLRLVITSWDRICHAIKVARKILSSRIHPWKDLMWQLRIHFLTIIYYFVAAGVLGFWGDRKSVV